MYINHIESIILWTSVMTGVDFFISGTSWPMCYSTTSTVFLLLIAFQVLNIYALHKKERINNAKQRLEITR